MTHIKEKKALLFSSVHGSLSAVTAKRAAGEQFNNHLDEQLLRRSGEPFVVQQTPADAQICSVSSKKKKRNQDFHHFFSSRDKSVATELFKLTVYFSTQ